jgi:hypothetical protein
MRERPDAARSGVADAAEAAAATARAGLVLVSLIIVGSR